MLKLVPVRIEPLIWVNYNDLTATSLEIIVSKGNHPQMAARFRLVNYYNLPRLMMPDIVKKDMELSNYCMGGIPKSEF